MAGAPALMQSLAPNPLTTIPISASRWLPSLPTASGSTRTLRAQQDFPQV